MSPDVDVSAGGRIEPESETAADLQPREQAALDRIRRLSTVLDDAVRVPGTNVRVGLDPVLGIVPGAGDAIAAAISLYVVFEAYRLDAPRSMLAKMVGLLAVDAVIGSIPLLGPVFDAFWKANAWNAKSLERHLTDRTR